ncbi:UxaA family hydrolase [Aneurinibacillus tyrosinisolvens]|uniref:UxaA family hydrolase n=1 Tax=Aneurinibacillus tyrosinisolvens TaxID=1443435 RepID=UPI00063F0612|nr:UxaA family hydrolase [Aneurinibacillus tyrosinisolvens]
METAYKTVMMKPYDKVAVALMTIPAGTVIEVTCLDKTYIIKLVDEIDFGHKFAVVPIGKGEDILKYGEVIGMACQDIAVGEHVHVHNLEGKRGRGDKIGAGQ